MKIGYIRISSGSQKSARQEILMRNLGVDKVYIDIISGKNINRPQLEEMMNFIRNDDVLIVESISRFARNTKDLLELIDKLNKKDVQFISQKEAIDTSTATGKFMLTVFGAVAELEREYILQRQKEGVAIAKEAGKFKGRQPIEIDEIKFKKLYSKWKDGHITAKLFMNEIGVKPNTFYRRIKQFEEN